MPDSVDRQLGQIAATMAGMQNDIREIKAVQKETNAKVGFIELGSAQRHQQNTMRLDQLKADVSAMKGPVSQWISIRNIGIALAAIVTSMFGVFEAVTRFFSK